RKANPFTLASAPVYNPLTGLPADVGMPLPTWLTRPKLVVSLVSYSWPPVMFSVWTLAGVPATVVTALPGPEVTRRQPAVPPPTQKSRPSLLTAERMVPPPAIVVVLSTRESRPTTPTTRLTDELATLAVLGAAS